MQLWKSSVNAISLTPSSSPNPGSASPPFRDVKSSRLPPAVRTALTRVTLKHEGLDYPSSFTSATSLASAEYSDSYSVEKFKSNMSLNIIESSSSQIVFDAIGLDAPIMNALRRILISEVPSVAIETVEIWQNTGVIQDEVLAHRLGLIPFVFDPDELEFREDNEELLDTNSLCFSLKVKCTEANLDKYRNYLPVYSKDLKWEPTTPAQKQRFADNPPRVVDGNILIAKLGCGQEIELKAYVEKGIGREHAKWSPVCTASYRLLPEFDFNANNLFNESAAKELVQLCPMDVFDIEDGVLTAKYPRNCTSCRMCVERFPEKLKLHKLKNHFIFSIESVGTIPAPKLFSMAIQVLKKKSTSIRSNLDAIIRRLV